MVTDEAPSTGSEGTENSDAEDTESDHANSTPQMDSLIETVDGPFDGATDQ